MTREDYGSHTEADAGAFARAHAEPDENPMTLADVADDDRAERVGGHVCSRYYDTGLTVLSAAYGHVIFQIGDGPECVTSAGELREAKAYLVIRDRVRVDGQPLDESDVDLLLDVATRSKETAS